MNFLTPILKRERRGREDGIEARKERREREMRDDRKYESEVLEKKLR